MSMIIFLIAFAAVLLGTALISINCFGSEKYRETIEMTED